MRFYLYIIIFCFSFLVLVGKSEAGWYVGGQCQPTQAAALSAFNAQFPAVSGNFYTEISVPIFDPVANTLTATYTVTDLTQVLPQTATLVTSNLVLCDPVLTVPQVTNQSLAASAVSASTTASGQAIQYTLIAFFYFLLMTMGFFAGQRISDRVVQ